MHRGGVIADRSVCPARLIFPSEFNAAVPFIDRHVSEGRASKPAIRTLGGDVTYGELAANVNRAAAALTALGLVPGDRLLMIVEDCPAFFYAFWGAIKAGIVPVPLNTLLRSGSYRFMIEDSGAAAILYSPERADEVGRALQCAGHQPRHVLITEGAAGSFADLLHTAAPSFEAVPATADSDCFWLYSSGSTGHPKAAVHRHRDIVIASELYGYGILGIGPDDVLYSEAKLFFAYGLGNALAFPLWAGAASILNAGKPGPETSLPIIEHFRPTVYFSVPTLYAAFLAHSGDVKTNLPSLRCCVSAGEALPAAILRRWHEATGLWILDGIGSTEALHIFISNTPGCVQPGSSGKPVPGYGAKIVDGAGTEIAGEGSGRLFVSGGSVARCYWRNPLKTAATMLGDWLDTGDTFRRDADGYYYFLGRTDDMMKVGGIWCSPFDIEAALAGHPAVLEAAVVGRTDVHGLTKPEAFVVLSEGLEGSEALSGELVQLCKDRLAPYQYPRWINYVPALPRTATGKIQRFRLRGDHT